VHWSADLQLADFQQLQGRAHFSPHVRYCAWHCEKPFIADRKNSFVGSSPSVRLFWLPLRPLTIRGTYRRQPNVDHCDTIFDGGVCADHGGAQPIRSGIHGLASVDSSLSAAGEEFWP